MNTLLVKIKYLYEYDKVVLELDAQNNNQSGRNIYGSSLIARTVKKNNMMSVCIMYIMDMEM
jgi:hypothetical protein